MEITELAMFKLPRLFFPPHLLQSIPSFFPTEDQGGCGPGSRRSQLPSCQPPRPEGVTLPDGFQWEQGPAEGPEPHHRRDHDVKERGGGSP